MVGAARERYVYQKANPRAQLPSWERPLEDLSVYYSSLCVLLLPAVPEEVQRRVLEAVDEHEQLTAVRILDAVRNFVALEEKRYWKDLRRSFGIRGQQHMRDTQGRT